MAEENDAAIVAEAVAGTATSDQSDAGTTAPQEPTWHYADGVPGSGDPPDWFKATKYKTLADQALFVVRHGHLPHSK